MERRQRQEIERQRRRRLRAASLTQRIKLTEARQEIEKRQGMEKRQRQEIERQRRKRQRAASLTKRIEITLPDDILEMVLLRVNSILDVVSFSLTSWYWYRLVRSTAFWQLQPACGKNFVLFCSSSCQVWQKFLVPSSSWNTLDTDLMKMFNLGGHVNGQIGVISSNGMLCIFPSLDEFYIVDPVNSSTKAYLLGPPQIPQCVRQRLLFYFDSLTNKYILAILCRNVMVLVLDYVPKRGWTWDYYYRLNGIIRESFLILHKSLYFLTKSEEEGLHLCAVNLYTRKVVQKKSRSIELEALNSFSFFLFANKRKLMLLGASSLMLRVWTIHEEKDECTFKLHSTFQLARKHKGCKLSSGHGLVLLQYCKPPSVIAYCPSTSEWQYITSPHNKIGSGIEFHYYALETSKIFPNYFQQQVGKKKAEMSMEFLGAREE